MVGDMKKNVIEKHGTVRLFDSDTLEEKKCVDMGPCSPLKPIWHKLLNQVVVSTSTGEAVMLYNPSRSKKGALFFVGRKAKALEFQSSAIHTPIFNISTYAGYEAHADVANGTMVAIRKRHASKPENSAAHQPERPAQIGSDYGIEGVKAGVSIFTQTYLAHMGGKKRLHDENAQKALLSFADECEANPYLVDHAYAGNKAPLDYSGVESEGDKMMKGDFCRKCGQKVCKCVDYRILPKRRRQDGTIIKNLEPPKPAPTTDRGIQREKPMAEIEADIMAGKHMDDD